MNRFVNLSCFRLSGPPSRALVLVGTCLVMLTWFGCSKRAAESPVLARVGSTVIRAVDLQNEAVRRFRAGRPVPDKQSLLEEMVTRAALVERAKQTGLMEDPEVQRAIDNLLVSKLHDRELLAKLTAVKISEEDLRRAYEKRREHYTRPAKVRLALLVLKAHPKMSPVRRAELRQRMEEARVRALAHPPTGGRGPAANGFGRLAVDYSEDQASRYRGGDIGWLDDGRLDYRWPRPVLEAGYALQPGEISPVIETENGFYLVKKTDTREAFTQPFASVKAVLRQQLLVEKRQALETAFRRQTREAVAPHIDREALAAVTLPSPAQALARRNEAAPFTLSGPSARKAAPSLP